MECCQVYKDLDYDNEVVCLNTGLNRSHEWYCTLCAEEYISQDFELTEEQSEILLDMLDGDFDVFIKKETLLGQLEQHKKECWKWE